jgi:hypothetical protein
LTWFRSVEGGLDELEESCPTRASRSAMRRSRAETTAAMAARSSGGVRAQRSSGMGGGALMSLAYRSGADRTRDYPRERLPHDIRGRS